MTKTTRPPCPCPSHLKVELRDGQIRKFYCTQGPRGHDGDCKGTKPRWQYLAELRDHRDVFRREIITIEEL